MYDTIVVGAGAAGLMTAITAARAGMNVLLLDGQKKIGAKILMSGGTRCNVTNTTITEKDYSSGQLMRVRNILRGFDNDEAIKFFKGLGVELILEPTGKYFPTTHSGKTVLDALLAECARQKVEIRTAHRATEIDAAAGILTVKGSGFSLQSRSVVLTTGGLSYPSTGSDGVGYRLAKAFGHTVLPTMAALTPFTTNDNDLKSLSGISLPVRLDLYAGGKKSKSLSEDFLFTHFGFSGPAALDLSRHWVAANSRQPQVFANFLPSEDEQSFEALLHNEQNSRPKRSLKNFLCSLLPERLVTVLLSKVGFDGHKALNQVTKEVRRKIVTLCVHYPLAVTGVVGYSKAEVTAGGVDLAEVNPKTLESNLQPGLFFAGEILDVDGRIGGFNFQWAWASGHAVGQAVARVIPAKAGIQERENHESDISKRNTAE